MDAQIQNKDVEATKELADSLALNMKRADWFAHYSDDPGVRSAGAAHLNAIHKDLEKYAATDPAAAAKLWDEYAPKGEGAPIKPEYLRKIDAQVNQDQRPAERVVEVADTPELRIDKGTLDRLAAVRSRDTAQVKEALGLNSIEPGIEKARQELSAEEDAKRAAWLRKRENPEQRQAHASEKHANGNQVESDEIFTASKTEVRPVVPPEIEKEYLRVGNKYYHPKNTEAVAFEDKGNKLETKSNSEQIAESMVRIAESRGWDEIKVSGSETFRREVWLEAATRGMHVKGYTPTEQDKVELAKRAKDVETNKIEKDNQPFRARENEPAGERKPYEQNRSTESERDQANRRGQDEKATKAIAGVVVAHGAAKYMHDEKNSDSYYVTTRDDKGVEKTSWGVDLARAMRESGAKVGDKISLENEGQKFVTVTVPVRDKNGQVVDMEEKGTHRNTWNVQLAETFRKDAPEEGARKHPELAGAYAAASAIEKQAEADGLNPQQRAVVMARVRQNMVNSIERGNFPEVKVREQTEIKLEAKEELEQTR